MDYSKLPEKPKLPHHFYSYEKKFVVLDLNGKKLKIAYLDEGEGKPLLLIHGMMTNSYSFRYIIDDLKKSYRILVPDLPGAGNSDAPEWFKMTPKEMADVIKLFSDKITNDKPYVVGNSLGGYIALWSLFHHPDYLDRLYIMHSPGFINAKHQVLSFATSLSITKSIFEKLTKNPEKFVSKRMHYFNDILSKEEVNEYSGILKNNNQKKAFYLVLKNTLHVKYMKQMQAYFSVNKPKKPIFLQWAKNDVVVSPKFGLKYKALLGIKDENYVEFDNTSHFLQVDIPKETVDQIISFGLK